MTSINDDFYKSEGYRVNTELVTENTLGLDFQWWWNMKKYKEISGLKNITINLLL